jgi:biotin carboxyl carrier protein
MFMRYRVAGAYDSNIALLLTKGDDRLASYLHLSTVLARTSLRGQDVATNLEFHYGLVNWFIGQNVMAKPTTRFVVPYLTLMGQLKDEANKIDTVAAFLEMKKHYAKQAAAVSPDDAALAKAMSEVLDRKGTLLTRPMDRLLADPHLLSGWLSLHRNDASVAGGKLTWRRNPLAILSETYEYLNMAWDPKAPAAEVIWEHDQALLSRAVRFYAEVRKKLGLTEEQFKQLDEQLRKEAPQGGYDAPTWEKIRAAHLGFEAGNELLGLLFMIAEKVKFFAFKVEEDLEVTIPPHLNDVDLQVRMKKVLVPPPVTKADEIVAVSGGMYYGQEAPGRPRFVEEGMHFDKGQPLYVVEVMKMFNTIRAPFSGTIDKIVIQGGEGTIVQKGQPLFKITPDEKHVEVDPREVEKQRRASTAEALKAILE